MTTSESLAFPGSQIVATLCLALESLLDLASTSAEAQQGRSNKADSTLLREPNEDAAADVNFGGGLVLAFSARVVFTSA